METLIIPNDRKLALQQLHPYGNLTGINIRVDQDNINRLEGLFMQTPRLRTLEVEATSHDGFMDSMPSLGELDCHACHHISKTLFSSVSSGQRDHLPLRVLNLKGFDFELASSLLVAAVAFQHLRILILQDCRNVSVLLNDASGFVGSDLNHLLITSGRRIERLRSVAFSSRAVETFLEAATGLQSLAIDAPIDHALEPGIESFARPGLKSLMLRCTPPPDIHLDLTETEPKVRHRYWALRQLRKLVHQCPSLIELAINFPPIPISFDLEEGTLEEYHPEYLAFLVSTLAASSPHQRHY